MNKQEFATFCHELFTSYGFQKKRSMYVCQGQDGILCGLWLKKSNYGPSIVIMYHYYFCEFDFRKNYPTPTNYDLASYIKVMSKEKVNGKTFMTGSIVYEHYTQEELLPYLNNAFNEYILPSIRHGINYFLDHNDHLVAHHTKEKSVILDLLRT